MRTFAQREPLDRPRGHLPGWWRFVLVALGTIILCSCTAPALQTAVSTESDNRDSIEMPTHISKKAIAQAQYCEISDMGCAADGAIISDPANAFGARTIADPYGPLVGPADEYLCDGGDFGTPAGVHEDWVVEGLEEEDAVGHYDTIDGRTILTPSNRVCIYAPRFAAVRRVVGPIAYEQPEFVNVMLDEASPMRAEERLPVLAAKQRHAVAVDLGQRPASLFRQRQQAGGLENLQAATDVFTSIGPYANLTIIRTGEVSAAETALLQQSIASAITWTGVQAPQVVFGVKMAQAEVGIRQPGVIYHSDEPNHPRLRLIKLASRGHALPGEEVEFTLRFDNIGDQVIGNVTIVDNLSARLEYIPATATSSVEAQFRTEPSDTGSGVLRWEIKDPVEPGQGGVLRFRTRVR